MVRVAIIGVGWYGFKPSTPEVSFREMMFEAAVKAYEDAGGLNPREDIDAFVTCEEDYWSGISIFDEFVPDPLGGWLKPVYTITGDGLQGIAAAYMKIKTGAFNVVVVEAHSKASEIKTYNDIVEFACDPVYNRLGVHPYYIAGLEARSYMLYSKATREHYAMIVEKNKNAALTNPNASYASKVCVNDVLSLTPAFDPLTWMDIAPLVDVAIVMVLASEEIAKTYSEKPIWIEGIGWSSDSPSLEFRCWDKALYAKRAAEMAYKMAGIENPAKQVDLFEIDDKFSYKELQHIEALKLASNIEAPKMLEKGDFHRDGALPVNPSGGFLGMGNALEASGLVKTLEVVLQLRGEAYGRQVKGAKKGVAMSWRGIPTATGATIILSSER